MSPAKAKASKTKTPKAKTPKAKVPKAKVSKTKASKSKVSRVKPSKAKVSRGKAAKPKSAAAHKSSAAKIARQFRFNAAQTVRIHFKGEKTPENFRIDDMVEASINTLHGQATLHFQYRLVSNDKSNPDGSERTFWFFDPKPVDASDPIDPSLWQPAKDATVADYKVVEECSGNFSTRSVTSYDGSGFRLVVKLDDKAAYRMRLELNGKTVFCDSRPLVIRKDDVLAS